MAITPVGSAKVATAADASSASLSLSGITILAGDLIVVAAYNKNSCTWATPSGYTLLADFQGAGDTACFYKVAAGGESSVLIDPNTTNAAFAAIAAVYRGVDTSNPWDVAYGDQITASHAYVEVDQLTTVTAGAWHLLFTGQPNTSLDSTFTTPSGYTARQHAFAVNTAGNSAVPWDLFDKEYASAGTTTPTQVVSNRTNTGLSWSLALRPAVGADQFVDVVAAGPGVSGQAAHVDLVAAGPGFAVPAAVADSGVLVADPRNPGGAPTPARLLVYLPDGLI